MSTQSLSQEKLANFVGVDQSTQQYYEFVRAETNYLNSISIAETTYGALHGEIGVMLIKLADLYRRYGYHEEAIAVEERIAEIAAVYLEDQRWHP